MKTMLLSSYLLIYLYIIFEHAMILLPPPQMVYLYFELPPLRFLPIVLLCLCLKEVFFVFLSSGWISKHCWAEPLNSSETLYAMAQLQVSSQALVCPTKQLMSTRPNLELPLSLAFEAYLNHTFSTLILLPINPLVIKTFCRNDSLL